MPKSWEDYTAAELQKFKAGLKVEDLKPDEAAQIPALDALIAEKLATEAQEGVQKAETFKRLSKKLDARAHKMFPELKDKDGEMAQKTNEYLEQLGTGTTDPNALLTASLLAADDLGVEPVSSRATPDPEKTGTGGKGKPIKSEEPETDALFTRTSKLAKMLEAEGVLDLSKEGVKERIAANHTALVEDV